MSFKVLLVEDEISIADNVRMALQQEGLSLTHAKTVGEARLQMIRDHFAVIVLDVGLPDQSGFDFCRELRRTDQTPILFLTARASEVDKIVGFELGADDYLTKPFSPRELSLRVRALGHRGRKAAPTDRWGLFQVDHEKFRICFDGKPLELSRYEFKLLELLIRRPGVVFSRTQLMQSLWDDPEMSLERTVDAHIKSLRAKLKDVRPDLSPIQTHRGLGYSLSENDT
jgi:two-component system catabolic regulation response regulator CreB